MALRGNFSGLVCSTDPVKVSKDTASLLVCTLKKFFCLGVRVFREWRNNWRTFRPPWPTLPGPGRQPLGGSILVKFLLEIRLQSESFDSDCSLIFRFIKKFWAHFPDFCVSKSESCLPWSSDAFFELSASKVYKNVLGAFSRVLHAKTKLLAVKSRRIVEVFTLHIKKKVLGAFSRFLRPKTKVFAVKFRRILEFLCLQVLQKKFWAIS